MSLDHKNMRCCFGCGGQFQMGPHRYAGRWIPSYEIEVCEMCWNANWDGWHRDAADKIIVHLTDNNLPIPPLNNKGWLPRD
jgi:hypothetical protein